MKKAALLIASATVLAALPLAAEDKPKTPPTPSEIIASSKPDEWVAIAPADLLVMQLAPDAKGKARRVVIQLMPAPFSQGWVGNIKRLAAAHWWDGTAIVRVQDNYVTQWGDPNGEDEGKAKKLPKGLAVVPERDYTVPSQKLHVHETPAPDGPRQIHRSKGDAYAEFTDFMSGWPVARDHEREWPLHCYGAVGVGRGLSPDTGSGAELYTVIGHAPRHLDRNIAVVGRIIEGMEHMSSLPRGIGTLGFYETAAERVPIKSVRLASEMKPNADLKFEYLSTESKSFAGYANARANRKDDFFIMPAGGADICNIPVPIRRKAQ